MTVFGQNFYVNPSASSHCRTLALDVFADVIFDCVAQFIRLLASLGKSKCLLHEIARESAMIGDSDENPTRINPA
jgi:hypothetical protein